MSPAPTRRQLLRSAIALSTSAALAGCNQSADAETTSTQLTTSPSANVTSTDSGRDALLTITRETYLAKAWTTPQDIFRFPKGDSIPLENLNETVRDAVGTAIDSDHYTTRDASNTLLDGIDAVTLVSDNGTVWDIQHTFPTTTIRLDTNIPDTEAVENRTVTYDSGVIRSSEAINTVVGTIAPLGVQTEPRPYVTTRLDPDVQGFLDQYDYIETPRGDGEIVVSRTNRTPPHTIRAEAATDEELYGRRIREADDYGPPTKAFIDRIIQSERKTPSKYQDRIHTIYPNAVPREFARDLDHGSNYVRVEDDVYGFDTRHVHWDEFPLEFQGAVVKPNSPSDGVAEIHLSLQNPGTETVQLQMTGPAPFGVLWAYGPGGEHVLWNDAYEASENVVIEQQRVVPERSSETELVPGQSLSETYRIGHDHLNGDTTLQSGTYEVLGTIWAKWPTYNGAKERDWRSQLFPYTLTIEVA